MYYLALIVTIICHGYRKKNSHDKKFTFGISNNFILLKETGDPKVPPVIGFSWKHLHNLTFNLLLNLCLWL